MRSRYSLTQDRSPKGEDSIIHVGVDSKFMMTHASIIQASGRADTQGLLMS